MENLKSITSIQKVIYTQREPVVVLANDLQYYICKHTFFSPATILFNEYLATRFLELWNLFTPPMAFVTVAPEQLNLEFISTYLQPRSFHKTCVGFKYLEHAKEVDNFLSGAKLSISMKGKFNDYTALLKIALFDLWVTNNDRNHNNYNLMIGIDKSNLFFVPIDHENIFDGNNLHGEIAELTETDSIINSELFNAIYPKHNSAKFVNKVDEVCNYFYICQHLCRDNLEIILNDVPEDWEINIPVHYQLIVEKLFSESWSNSVINQFRKFLHTR